MGEAKERRSCHTAPCGSKGSIRSFHKSAVCHGWAKAGTVGSGPRGRALWHGAEQQGTSLSHQRCPSEQTPSDLEVAVGETHCFTHPPEPRKPVAIPPRLQLTAKFLPCCLPLCAYVLMSHPLEISNKTSKVGKDILREREEIGHISFLEDWPCVGPN